MSDIFYKLFCSFPTIPLVEVVALIFFTVMRVRRRLIWVIGSYLIFFAVALAFASTHRDEFGYSFIPAAYISWPWIEILMKSNPHQNLFQLFLFSAGTNCTIFYLIDRLIVSLSSGRRSVLLPNLQESNTKP